jgi:nickel-type superoxide dismutase maturation protease
VSSALTQRFVRRVQVAGTSMAPTLEAGQRVTAVRRWRALRPGDLVVVEDPAEPDRWLIKRVHAVGTSGVELRGDNPEFSTDSRHFGPVRQEAVRWIVLARSLR